MSTDATVDFTATIYQQGFSDALSLVEETISELQSQDLVTKIRERFKKRMEALENVGNKDRKN